MKNYCRDNGLGSNPLTKGCIVLLTLLCAAFAYSCSAETKNSSGDGTNIINTGTANNGTAQPNNGSVVTGGGGNNAATIDTNTTSTATTNTFEPGGDVCAGAKVKAARIKPRVMFIVDRSGSTSDAYPGSTSKWQAMYDALMDPTAGVIAKLQHVAYFGMVLFDGGEMDYAIGWVCFIPGMCGDAGIVIGDASIETCPRLVYVEPALDNYNAIKAQYENSGPGGTTPTARALEKAYALMPDDQQILDKKTGSQFAVLCTDGLPNGCIDSFGLPDQQGPIDQVTAAAKRGIKTYVVGVAAVADNPNNAGGLNAQSYLEELAKFGETGAPAFSPATKQDLVDSISKIVGGAVGCNVRLNGKVAGDECLGTVSLNSQKLDCKGADGWKLVNESEIELQGKACQQFMNDPTAMVDAQFPCGSFVLE